MLVQTAAQIWKVDPAGIRTDSNTAFHDTSGRQFSYAALVNRAGSLTAPQNPTLKDPKDFKLIGKPLKRLAALGNALFAATGIRLRRLPIDRDVLSGKKPA